MLSFRSFLSPPVFLDNDEKTRVARLIYLVVWLTFLIPPILAHHGILMTLAMYVVLIIHNLVVMWIMHKGIVQPVALSLSLIFWVMMTWNAATLGLGSLYNRYFAVVAVAGMLLGWRGAAAFTALSIVTTGVLAHAEFMQWITPTSNQSPLGVWEEFSAILIIVSVFLSMTMSSLQALTSRVRKSEQELALKASEAEALASQATEAQHAAEAANKAKSTFLASMSHELRTPLNGILGYAQILDTRPGVTADMRRELRIIRECGQHLLTLINDVLDMAKIEANRLDLVMDVVRLSDFLDVLAGIVRGRVDQKPGLSLITEIDPELPPAVRTDEKRLRQVLLNLLGNAVKFTSAGMVAFRVKILDSNVPGRITLRFEVQDTGPGIPSDKLNLLFRPFEQVGDAQSRSEGTGLGLVISQRLINAMGGAIRVKSGADLETGSLFWFDLYLALAEDNQQHKSQNIPTGYEGVRKRILVADDKMYNRMVLQGLLGHLGFDIYEAENGRDAVEKARQFQPDLILMDLVMPEMNGFEAAAAIRKEWDGNSYCPVIVGCSASVFDQDKQASTLAGCDDFLPKPINAADLYHLLGEHLCLAWTYANAAPMEAVQRTPTANNLVGEDILLPGKDVLENILAMADDGDLYAIERAIAGLESSYPEFASVISQHASNLDDVKIAALLRSLLERR